MLLSRSQSVNYVDSKKQPLLHCLDLERPPTSLLLQPERAEVYQILSVQAPTAVQSGSLWRDRCVDDKLANNYRVGHYNVDYSSHAPQSGEQSQPQAAYDPSIHQQNQSRNQTPYHNPVHGSVLGGFHHGSTPTQETASLTGSGSNSNNQQQHQTPQRHSSHLLMNASGLRHHRMDPPQFGNPGSLPAPMYSTMSTPHNQQSPVSHHIAGIKRPRSSDLDLSVASMPELSHADLDGVSSGSLGAAYAQAAQAAVSAGQQTQHHHHRLPDSEPLAKFMRRDDAWGGAPSVVGQPGMPEPAARPRGPKLKFTSEDDQLLIDLKENKNLTWKQIADFFPGRSSGTLQVRYCTRLKAKTTLWTDEMVRQAHSPANTLAA